MALPGGPSPSSNMNKVSLATIPEVSPYSMHVMPTKGYFEPGSEGSQLEIAQEWALMQRRLREDLEAHLSRQNHLVQGLLERYGAGTASAARPHPLPKRPPTPPDSPEAVDLDEHVERMRAAAQHEAKLQGMRLAGREGEDGAKATAGPHRLQDWSTSHRHLGQEQVADTTKDCFKEVSTEDPSEVAHMSHEIETSPYCKAAAKGESAAEGDTDSNSMQAQVSKQQRKLDAQPKELKTKVLNYLFAQYEWWRLLEEPKRVGCLNKIVKDSRFEALSLIMVISNCMFIVYTKNYGMAHLHEPTPTWHEVVEGNFAGYFFVEIVMRITLHRQYFFCNEEMGWNCMDFFIVGLSTWNLITLLGGESLGSNMSFLRSLRILKLVRVLRLLRMVKMFTDLRIMVVAFLNSCLALMWCLVLLFYTLAIFSLVFVQFVGDHLEVEGHDCNPNLDGVCLDDQLLEQFGSVQRAMLSLYMGTTGGNDWSLYYDMLSQIGGIPAVAWICYTALYFFGVFNLLTGMFVDKAVRASQPDADLLTVECRHDEKEAMQGLLDIIASFDVNSNGVLDMKEFVEVVTSTKGSKYLQGLGLEPKHTEVVYEELRQLDAEVPTMEFVRGCMRLRGQACNLDMTNVRYELGLIRREQKAFMKTMTDLTKALPMLAAPQYDHADRYRRVMGEYSATAASL